MSVPKLTHREEFEAVLADYHMSVEANSTLAATPFVLMVATTSTGRNTIINELLQTGRYYFIVSDTTRPPRLNNGMREQNGVEYFFRTEEEVLADLRKGRFVEAAIIHDQQVSGVSIREIAKAQAQGKVAITDIEVVGAENIVRRKPDALPLFILPPSFEEWLDRIQKRTPVTEEELHRRFESAVKEFTVALSHDYYLYVINDTLEHAVEQVDNIARFDKVDEEIQVKARQLLADLLVKTKAYLHRSR